MYKTILLLVFRSFEEQFLSGIIRAQLDEFKVKQKLYVTVSVYDIIFGKCI